ncbi:hypothetical protein PoB_003712800 [Plakobranchus ocellatus]|uniref:Uncharacterized protein n=1 Tax=Plakobranchus ocellatus TaxID=259542 RepID=A0AAV4AUW5_9GAST|nr:hypothetical protein PoB_003712800 [Plakobranchus ocellatus]
MVDLSQYRGATVGGACVSELTLKSTKIFLTQVRIPSTSPSPLTDSRSSPQQGNLRLSGPLSGPMLEYKIKGSSSSQGGFAIRFATNVPLLMGGLDLYPSDLRSSVLPRDRLYVAL